MKAIIEQSHSRETPFNRNIESTLLAAYDDLVPSRMRFSAIDALDRIPHSAIHRGMFQRYVQQPENRDPAVHSRDSLS
ncbi:hypothetical protein [Paraburkholderia sp. BCC1876]|uniref:hypothetical protein n=1 Tax=Paraburkholderia sp. BCC1876 TaxID=2676303 RepID=UPI001590D2C2|nr:hypothetical protein [Paraburkholderia sp. BCC1876]